MWKSTFQAGSRMFSTKFSTAFGFLFGKPSADAYHGFCPILRFFLSPSTKYSFGKCLFPPFCSPAPQFFNSFRSTAQKAFENSPTNPSPAHFKPLDKPVNTQNGRIASFRSAKTAVLFHRFLSDTPLRISFGKTGSFLKQRRNPVYFVRYEPITTKSPPIPRRQPRRQRRKSRKFPVLFRRFPQWIQAFSESRTRTERE